VGAGVLVTVTLGEGAGLDGDSAVLLVLPQPATSSPRAAQESSVPKDVVQG